MTEEEKARRRALKDEARSWLQERQVRAFRDHGAVFAVDPRLGQYVSAVAWNPEGHNLYELLAVRRFLGFLYEYGFDAKAVGRFIRFYELLRFDSPKGRRPHVLSPIQVFMFANIFGLLRPDGRRLITDVTLFVPRKFGKTTSMAGLAVYDMLLGDNNAEVYIAANAYDQAKKCFDEIRAVMRVIDPNGMHMRINRERITFIDGQRDSSIQCLTANASTKDGLKASTVIVDEYAQAKSADLKNVLTTSMGTRENPLTVIITTASEVLDGPFRKELEGIAKVLRGELTDDSVFAMLLMMDVDDYEDDPRTWAKVQPHLGLTVQADYYAREWTKAQRSSDNLLAFRTKLLNRFVTNEAQSWFTMEKARSMVGAFDIDKVPKGTRCAVAFDLSVRDDFSAVTYAVYDPKVRKFFFHTEYYFPRGALEGHVNRQLYMEWHRQGHLKFCEGDRINTDQVGADILRRARFLHVLRISYDPYKSKDLVNLLSPYDRAGALQPFRQTFGEFNVCVECFEMAAYSDPCQLEMNDNPINPYCLVNSTLEADKLENRKPVKIAHSRKIDGAITMLMCLGSIIKTLDGGGAPTRKGR